MQSAHPAGPLRILYVEDDERLHLLIPELVDARSFVFHCAATADEALALVETLAPDLALVDLGLPDLDGVTLIERMVTLRPGMPIVVLTIASTQARVVAAIAAGASGYLLKEDLGARLPSALVEAFRGEAPMSALAARAVLNQVRSSVGAARSTSSKPAPSSGSLLSPREREVVEQLSRGLTYEQVSVVLGVSINTVRGHIRAVYEKLGAGSKTEAVMMAIERGLVKSL